MEIQILVRPSEKPISARDVPARLADDLYIVQIADLRDSVFGDAAGGTAFHLSNDPSGQACSCDLLTGNLYADDSGAYTLDELKPEYLAAVKGWITTLVKESGCTVFFGMAWGRVEGETIERSEELVLRDFLSMLDRNRIQQDVCYSVGSG